LKKINTLFEASGKYSVSGRFWGLGKIFFQYGPPSR
jgi:hypothetical protein